LRRIFVVIGAAALLAPAVATAGAGASTPPQVKALQAQLKTQANQIAVLQRTVSQIAQAVGTLNSNLGTLNSNQTKLSNVVTCTTAQELTIDYSFFDLFDIIAGVPEQYAGQTVADNGACAAAGMTPPSPAESTRLTAETPMHAHMRAIAHMLGVLVT